MQKEISEEGIFWWDSGESLHGLILDIALMHLNSISNHDIQ